MEAFLHRVARTYIAHESDRMYQYCFVFPNKRSGVFFLKYLKSLSGNVLMLPQVTTISDLVSSLSGKVEAGRLELLFILYNEYINVVRSHYKDAGTNGSLPLPDDFDRFIYWGDMLLADFNDVDKYLVDPVQLFKNVKDFKELSANYLTDEQRRIIKRYWGDDVFHLDDVVDVDGAANKDDELDFWKHVKVCGRNHKAASRFLKLWEILYELYQAFNARLAELDLCYSGKAYRTASVVVKQDTTLPYKRYVFVGFNVLSTSELLIFECLKAKGLADFYWDFNSPALRISGNKAAKFLSNYIREFKSLYNLGEETISRMPNIRITGVPSNVGQIKELSGMLSRMVASGAIPDADNAIDTAIVLPDENLFLPLISNIPDCIGGVNVTMGFPLRNTPVATLISKVVGMQLRVRQVRGQYEFFREDVLNVLSHPLIKEMPGRMGERILDYMAENRLFNLPAGVVNERFPDMAVVFNPINPKGDSGAIYDYFGRLLDYVKQGSLSVIEQQYVLKCKSVVEELHQLTSEYGITMQNSTFFHLVERVLYSESVSFKGEPLRGLQIMGVLETRALDFKNVLMLSMNERVFPRRHFTRSFIPDALRRGYGMATVEFQESIYAYYFYRLIARAENVYLLYDARNTGIRSGEMSRYLYQLRYFFNPEQVAYDVGKYYIEPRQKDDVTIYKDERIMQRLFRYCEQGSGFNLSASAFKQYIKCPLQFYFERVADIRLSDDVKDYIDEGIYGDIVHHVAENLYTEVSRERGDITEAVLDDLISDKSGMVERQITASINELYNKLGKQNYTPLRGEAYIQAGVMKYLLKSLLKAEKQFAPIRFEAAEWSRLLYLKVNEEYSINFKLSIDRIDRSKGHKRVIDYKTGSDEIVFPDIESLFGAKKNYGGIFQTMLYCCVYAASTGYTGDIQPYIYSLKTLNVSHLPPLKIGSEVKNVPVVGYLAYKDEFWSYFQRLVNEIFNPGIPFVKAQTEHSCAYCKYLRLCGGK